MKRAILIFVAVVIALLCGITPTRIVHTNPDAAELLQRIDDLRYSSLIASSMERDNINSAVFEKTKDWGKIYVEIKPKLGVGDAIVNLLNVLKFSLGNLITMICLGLVYVVTLLFIDAASAIALLLINIVVTILYVVVVPFLLIVLWFLLLFVPASIAYYIFWVVLGIPLMLLFSAESASSPVAIVIIIFK